MEFQESRQGAVTVIKPLGPLTRADADDLRGRFHTLIDQSLGRLVFDLASTPFIDSAGLEALMDFSDAQADAGRALKLCNIQDTVREAMELTAIASRFETYADVNSAVRSYL